MDRELPATVDPAASPRRRAVPVSIAALVVIMVGAVASVIYVGSRPSDEAVAAVTVPGAVTEPVRVVPGLGKLIWTKLEGPAAKFGFGAISMTFSAEHGYRLFTAADQIVWESSDGLDWTLRDVPQRFGDFTIDGVGSSGYAVGSSGNGRKTLLEWTATGWVELADFGPITDTVGIVWRTQLDEPIQVGDAVLAHGRLYGELPWGELYGYFQRSTCTADCRQKGPRATWDATAQRLHLVHPFDETSIASLTIDVDGDTATFVDVDTQETVHEVVGTAGLPIHDIVGAIRHETRHPRGSVRLDGNLVSAFGGSFVYLRPPWWVEPPSSNGTAIFAAPDGSGFVAYQQVGDETTDPIDRDLVTDVRTWISVDAIEWTEAAAPPFPYPWAGGVIFSSRPGAIVAEGFSNDRTAVSRRLQLWESSDGLVWRERPPSPLPSHVPMAGMEFGYATTERVEDVPSSDRWRWRYWVLGDGDTWLEVVTPPAQPMTVGGGAEAWNRELGSVMYWGYGDASKDHLWVGRFES